MAKPCLRIAKHGSQCTRPAYRTSDFCWWHGVRGDNLTRDLILLSVGLLLGLAIDLAFHYVDSRQAREQAYRALTRKLPVAGGYPITLLFGTNSMVIEGAGPLSLTGVGGLDLGWNTNFRTDEKGTLFVDMEIRDEHENVIAFVDESHLFVQPGFPYDVNSDLFGFEVVDADRQPVLQIMRVDDGNTFRVRIKSFVRLGAFVHVAVCGDGACRFEPAEEADEFSLGSPLFAYPGYRHPGKRDRPRPQRTSELATH